MWRQLAQQQHNWLSPLPKPMVPFQPPGSSVTLLCVDTIQISESAHRWDNPSHCWYMLIISIACYVISVVNLPYKDLLWPHPRCSSKYLFLSLWSLLLILPFLISLPCHLEIWSQSQSFSWCNMTEGLLRALCKEPFLREDFESYQLLEACSLRNYERSTWNQPLFLWLYATVFWKTLWGYHQFFPQKGTDNACCS